MLTSLNIFTTSRVPFSEQVLGELAGQAWDHFRDLGWSPIEDQVTRQIEDPIKWSLLDQIEEPR